MSAIGPGDWVECIVPGCSVPMGTIWLVAAIGQAPRPVSCGTHGVDGCDGVWLALKGLATLPGHYGQCAACYRPIHRPKAEFLEQLLAPTPSEPAPAKELEPA